MTATVPAGTPLPTAAGGPGHSRVSQARTAFGLLLPSLFGLVFFLAIPVVMVVVLSFFQWDLLRPADFVGFSNYVDLFKYDRVGHSLLVTFYYVVLNIPLQTVIALGLALMLNRRLPAMGVFRILFVVPYLATPVAMAVVWNWIFHPRRTAT